MTTFVVAQRNIVGFTWFFGVRKGPFLMISSWGFESGERKWFLSWITLETHDGRLMFQVTFRWWQFVFKGFWNNVPIIFLCSCQKKRSYTFVLLKKPDSFYLRNRLHITLRNSFQVMVESECLSFILYVP